MRQDVAKDWKGRERRGGDMISDVNECARTSRKAGKRERWHRGMIPDANECARTSRKTGKGEGEEVAI